MKGCRAENHVISDTTGSENNNALKVKVDLLDTIAKDFSPNLIKIDVEGLELKVLNSILNCSDPFLIQVEVNINNPIFMESFSSINSVLNKQIAEESINIAQHFNLAYTQLKIVSKLENYGFEIDGMVVKVNYL